MSWFDIFLLASVAALTALGAKRKFTGLILGAGSLLLFRVLLTLADRNAIVGIGLAVLAGILFGMLGRASIFKQRGLELPLTIAGGLGGLVAGVLLVGTLITTLPIEKRFDGAIIYPPSVSKVGPLLAPAVNSSQLVKVGRSILLYPLLAEDATQLPTGQRGVYSALHSLFVVGQPWERSN